MPYQLLGVLLHTMAISGLSRVRTEGRECNRLFTTVVTAP